MLFEIIIQCYNKENKIKNNHLKLWRKKQRRIIIIRESA